MLHDQMITVVEAIVCPLLLINAIGLAKLASTAVRSVAGNAALAARAAVRREH